MTSVHAAAGTHRPHLELVRLGTDAAGRVRAWHSPERWVQAPADRAGGTAAPDVLGRLAERAGILADAPDGERPRRLVLVGSGVLARELAEQVREHLDLPLVLTAADAVPGPRPSSAAGPAGWQADLVARTPRGRVRLVRSDPCESWTPGTLVVVAGDTVETDRALLARLARRGLDHVAISNHHDRAVVGPWVHPGSASCLTCLDHWRADADPDYPMVLAELCRRPAVTQPALVRWAASLLVASLLRPDGGRSALDGRTHELDLSDADATGVQLRRHPRCTCHAAGTGLEGLAPAA